MRIIAGNSKINILSDQQNNSDFIVLAEVIDSVMGYEKPILVKNSRDLLIWFGDKFKEYNYFKELLDEDNVCLYLYRGIETGDSEKIISNRYYYIPDISPNTPETLAALPDSSCFWIVGAEENQNLLPEVGEEGVLYKVIRVDGVNYDPDYNIRYSYYQYIENAGTYILYDSIDESKEIKSLQNRDRLSVGYHEFFSEDPDTEEEIKKSILSYSYYNPGIENSDYVVDGEIRGGKIENFDKLQETVLSGHATRNLSTIYEDKMTSLTLKSDPYFPINSTEYPTINEKIGDEIISKKLTYFFPGTTGRVINSSNPLPDLDGDGIEDSFRDDLFFINYIKLADRDDIPTPTHLANDDFTSGICELDDIEGYLNSIGRTYESLIDSGDYTSKLNPNSPCFVRYNEFHNMPKGFTVKSNFILDQKDIYDFYVHDNEIYRFESKTIGKGSEDIKVEIKWIETYTEKNNIYSITISRYDYQEFYEGPLDEEFGFERLDYKISKDSKLVRFKIIPRTEPEQGWPEGEWELKGAYTEETSDSEYSFNIMCKSLEDFPPDFILIPNKGKAPSENRILDWTETLNCQALITNNKDDVEGNLDLGEDLENRLIHFYNQIRYDGEYRPGYYIFLKSLLSQDRYIPNSTRIVYHFPEDELDSKDENYEEAVENFYEKLERYRSNSLSLNNYYYYYDYYFPGENYSTTPLVRFVISKITRELEKNKWKIIGEKANKVSEDTIYPILRAIQSRFSIIRSIEINNFIVDGISRTVEASITTTLSDIISSDVSFDIILNYSKLNN